MYCNVKCRRIFPTVNTSSVKFDKFTVGANNTRRTKPQMWGKPFWTRKKMTSVWACVANSHSQQLKQQHTETTNTTKQHNIFSLRFRTLKRETQTGWEDETLYEFWLWPGLWKQRKANLNFMSNYMPHCKNDPLLLLLDPAEFIGLKIIVNHCVLWIFQEGISHFEPPKTFSGFTEPGRKLKCPIFKK